MKWALQRKVLQKAPHILVVGVLVSALYFGLQHYLASPKVVLLWPQHSAQWIGLDVPFNSAKFDFDTSAVFKTTVDFPSSETLEIAALRRVEVTVDDELLFDSGVDLYKWKTVYQLPIAAGHHHLSFTVSNLRGPSLLRVACPAAGLATNAQWQASIDVKHWSPARLASDLADAHLPPQFASPCRDLWRLSPIWGSFFVAGFLFCLMRSLHGPTVRWIVLLAWVVMAANNITKVPLQFGYDADSHYLYINHVADHLSLPPPDGGWQYFQAPLYYIVSAMLDRLLVLLGVADSMIPYLLRLVPLACGAAIIELSFRASRLLFPTRSDLQAIATLVGGLLPVNIYMSQAVSNEPMGAVVSAWITLIGLKFLINSDSVAAEAGRPGFLKQCMIAGLALGVGLLTKINTVLWIIPLAVAMSVSLKRNRANAVEWMKSILIIAGVAICISSGWIIRNLILIHRPFFLESSVANSQWWQAPGYRTPQMFYEFGHVFSHPIYNGLFSVWDSLYGTLWGNGIVAGQPPWNYGLMSCGLSLALIPTAAVMIGAFRAIFGTKKNLWFAPLAASCFVAAILFVYLKLPIYSCAKASYLLGTAPCIGVLAAAGFDLLMINRWLRAGVGGAILCWAAVAYLTYFIVN